MNGFYCFLYVIVGIIGFLISGLTISTIVFTIKKHGLKEFTQLARIPLIIYNSLSYIGYVIIFIVGVIYRNFVFGIPFIVASICALIAHMIIHFILHKCIKQRQTISIKQNNAKQVEEKLYKIKDIVSTSSATEPDLKKEIKQILSSDITETGVTVGTVVTHAEFGEGKIVYIDKVQQVIRVSFDIGEKTFVIPDCFNMGFLKRK
jgi:hypothetical protein